MAVFSIKSFGGVSPKTPPRYLQDTQAQVAINCPVFAGSLVPLPDVSASPVATLTKAGTPQTIYRYGQDIDSDSSYWFGWNYDVDVCRGQVASDPVEWTFYTGDGTPKATYNTIALTGTDLPSASIPLGVPAPENAPDATADPSFDSTTDYAAILYLDTVALANLTTDGIEVSVDNGGTFTTVSLGSLPDTNRQSYVAAQLDAVAGITAVVDGLLVKVTSDALGKTANITLKCITGTTTEIDETTTFTYSHTFTTVAGLARDVPFYPIEKYRWGSISGTTNIIIKANNNADALSTALNTSYVGSFANAAAFAAWLNTALAGKLTATAYGEWVALTPGTWGTSSSTYVGRIQVILGDKDSVADKEKIKAAADSEGASWLVITKSEYDTYLKGKYLAVTINGGDEVRVKAGDQFTAFYIPGLSFDYVDKNYTAMRFKGSTGTTASIVLKSGNYGTTTDTSYSTLSATGYEDTASVAESRVYTYTWVSKIATFEFESGPSNPSTSIDVFKGQKVTVSKLETPTVVGDSYYVTRGAITYQVTARRIYRSVNGIYLFVAEVGADKTEYVDETAAEDLAEEMSVTGWALPPDNLTGLINMPNGIMAGFVGRDVYFCDPYHPHAWPQGYVQTVDYPIVGLGRMDTTLAVLTKGVPYFIQGSHPDSMVVVKSDIQQSCAAKRSIVSISGTVLFASPDGLIMLSSSGSRIITDGMFTRAQWQALNPSSIHAYQHDSKYVAFYDTGTVQGGFMYDLLSGQFVFHDIYSTAGYNDLVRDQLFLSFSDKTIKRWFDGSNKTYVWRSKLFTMPQVMTFSCAQVEASEYPVTAKFYCDDAVTPFHTQTVASRNPFRLPAKVGRDWEVQLEGTAEVFAVNVSQSMQELAGA